MVQQFLNFTKFQFNHISYSHFDIFIMKLVSTFTIFLVLATIFAAEKNYTDFILDLKAKIRDPNNKLFHHAAYDRLAYISDSFGPRLWGSNTLEQVIHEIFSMAYKEGFDNVRLQAVKNFTKWVRGTQELYLHSPRPVATPLNVIGLGGSVSGHVKANAIVVDNYTHLEQVKDQIKGKIVVYNQKWTNYGESVQYRSSGAWRASKYGAVAALVRSVTPVSISSVHTGIQHYNSNFPKIPFAAITLEDAEMLERMQARNQTITLELKLQSKQYPNTYSNNVVFQIKGAEKPDEILLMGGHIDSWDTGSQTGANDDGGGFISCFEAMRLLLKNGYRPKRTIMFIAWSGEEWGDPRNGAHAYIQTHQQQLKNHIVAFEDDLGSTKLYGFGYSGSPEGKAIVTAISNQYMDLIDATTVSDDGMAVDIGPLFDMGIPTMVNLVQDTTDHQFYFTYHHTAGDSMTMMDPDLLDGNVLGIACMFFILADLETSIPKPNIKQEVIDEIIQKIRIGKRQ